MKILLTLSYDGTRYAGWQIQKNAPSVQQALNEALSQLYKTEIMTLGASRTDAGVHATCQKASFSVYDNRIPCERLPYAVNAFLPDDVTVTRAEYVTDTFHPINDAKQKTYEYVIKYGTFLNPKDRLYAEFVRGGLDADSMTEAVKHFVGRHDFKSFCASGTSAKTTVRTVFNACLTKDENTVKLYITGDGFLYNMVRIIAGTLIYVGQGKIRPDDIPGIITAKDRVFAGKTAGPSGLTLIDIIY